MRRIVRRWAVVPAAGRGARFGARTPKQYARLLGRPVLSWAVAGLLAERSIVSVVVAIAPGDRRFARLALLSASVPPAASLLSIRIHRSKPKY